METRRDKVFETKRLYKIEIAREILEKNGFECMGERNFLIEKSESIALLVHQEDVNIANDILTKNTLA